MDRTMRVILGLFGIAVVSVVVTAVSLGFAPRIWEPAPAPLETPPELAVDAGDPTITETLTIKRGDTLELLLARAGVDRATSFEIATAIREVFDVRKFRAGKQLTLTRPVLGTVDSLEYIIDPDHMLELAPSEEGYLAAVVGIPSTIRLAPVCGTLQGSLFESIERTGEKAELAIQMAEVFAWDLDFYRDPRPGDEFCMLIEKKEYVNGQPPTYGRILSAKYINEGALYDAFLFPDTDGKPAYYSADGKSLQSAFLRSPLKFDARVSSRFSYRRLHPVLKVRRPHLGTDYAAPVGTPVRTIASGKVTFSARSGASGNLVKIQHANGFQTMYLHLSRRLVKRGQRVVQGQNIGLVGATGRVTGPHLDFRMTKNGKFLNFERLRLPRSKQITAKQRDAFDAERERLLALMEPPSTFEGPVLAVGPMPEPPAAVD